MSLFPCFSPPFQLHDTVFSAVVQPSSLLRGSQDRERERDSGWRIGICCFQLELSEERKTLFLLKQEIRIPGNFFCFSEFLCKRKVMKVAIEDLMFFVRRFSLLATHFHVAMVATLLQFSQLFSQKNCVFQIPTLENQWEEQERTALPPMFSPPKTKYRGSLGSLFPPCVLHPFSQSQFC